MERKEEEERCILAVPPAEGADFVRVVDRNGCVSRVFCSDDCTGCFDISWCFLCTSVIGCI